MAAKKTRKRAYIPPSHEVVNRRERAEGTTSTRPAPRTTRGAHRSSRAEYEYPEPSIRRTLKRLPIYFVLIFAMQSYLRYLDDKDAALGSILAWAAVQGAIVTIVFAPFMHMMDRFAYNRHQKRRPAAADTQHKAR